MRKKARSYDKKKSVRSIARERVGSPPPARVLLDERVRTKPKHKKPLSEEAE